MTTSDQIRHIAVLVARHFNLAPSQLIARTRESRIVLARQIAMCLAGTFTVAGSVAIGRSFHRTHATVIYARKAIGNRISTEPEIRVQVNALALLCSADPLLK